MITQTSVISKIRMPSAPCRGRVRASCLPSRWWIYSARSNRCNTATSPTRPSTDSRPLGNEGAGRSFRGRVRKSTAPPRRRCSEKSGRNTAVARRYQARRLQCATALRVCRWGSHSCSSKSRCQILSLNRTGGSRTIRQAFSNFQRNYHFKDPARL